MRLDDGSITIPQKYQKQGFLDLIVINNNSRVQLPNLTAQELFEFTKNKYYKGKEKIFERKLQALWSTVNIGPRDSLFSRKLESLSSGENVAIFIILNLLKGKDILVFDEAISSLNEIKIAPLQTILSDYVNGTGIFDNEMEQKDKKTILNIQHEAPEFIFDKVINLNQKELDKKSRGKSCLNS